MRIVIKSKSSNRVLREFDGVYPYQVYIPLENFIDGLIDAPDFVDSREYKLVVYRK